MPTKYDVFAEIFEKAPCKPKDLEFKTPIYAQVNSLISQGWVKKTKQGILNPIKNKETEFIFSILKWSLKNNLNYNFWFSENLPNILRVLSKSIPKINPKALSNNKKKQEIVNFFEDNQFLVLWKRKPKLGTLLNHSLFDLIMEKKGIKEKINEKYLSYIEINKEILKISKKEINPFDIKIFEFLAGSAQLEGSTVSIGETVDLILKSIYPDKPNEDIQMVKNLNESLHFIIDNLDKDLTIDSLKEINKRCLFSLHKGAGEFKKTQNKILGNPNFKTTSPEKVVNELEKFCEGFNKIKTREECLKQLGFIHNQHQRIHPFVDGNSRTTRFLVNWLLMKFKFPLLIIKPGAFEKYMSLTKLSTRRDDDNLRDFLLHLILHEELVNR
ncbi:Fic family protein [Patescibacteria group bacterium]|nr:Fic family protein [Patescibacteria group bacterium]